MSGKMQVLCGMIASGKSSYCKNAALQGGIIMNDDAIVNLLHAGNYSLYDKSLKILYKTTDNHIIGMALAMNKTVLVDRGLNIDAAGRRRWVALAKSFDVPVEALCFVNEGPEIHAQRRFNSESRGHSLDYWTKVAMFHNAKYQEPSKEEGFDEIHYINFSMISDGHTVGFNGYSNQR
jgi:predicted kinase